MQLEEQEIVEKVSYSGRQGAGLEEVPAPLEGQLIVAFGPLDLQAKRLCRQDEQNRDQRVDGF